MCRVSGQSCSTCRSVCTHTHTHTHTHTYPKEWKRTDLILIYKIGNKEEPLNYKPVSLTSIVF